MKKHDKIKWIIDDWMFKNFSDEYYKGRLIINFEVYGLRSIYLYTNYPGIIIGYKGKCINELRDNLRGAKINRNVYVVELSNYIPKEINIKRKWF